MEYPAGVLDQVSTGVLNQVSTGILDQVCELLETNLVVTPGRPVAGPKSVDFKKAFSSSPAGPPGSTPPLIHRFAIDVQSGTYAVSVLAIVDEFTADLVVLEDKSGLIEQGLDKAGPPDGERLVHQINWIIKTMEVAADYDDDDNVKAIVDVLKNSIQLDYLSSYEVKTDENIVTFSTKKILPPFEFNGLFQLTEKNKLGGGGENDYIVKLDLNKNTGKTLANRTQVIFSPRIKLLMPNFTNNRIRYPRAEVLSGEEFVHYLVQIEDAIAEDLGEAREAWEQRANFFVSIYRYRNVKPEDVINVNGEKVNVLSIFINTDVYEAIVKITLDDKFPTSSPSYNFKITLEGTRSKEFNWKASFIHKKKPYEDGWSIEGMAKEFVEVIPGVLDLGMEDIIEEVIQNAEINQSVGDATESDTKSVDEDEDDLYY